MCCAPPALTAGWDPGESWLCLGWPGDRDERKGTAALLPFTVTSVFDVSPLRASKICSQPLLEVLEHRGCL